MMKAILLCLLAAMTCAAPAADKTNRAPVIQLQQLGAGPPSPAPVAGVDLAIKVLASDARKNPIRGAKVRVLTVDGRILGEESTNTSGLIEFKGLPPGRIRIQILASGWKTYGEDFSLQAGVPQTKMVSLMRP